MHAIGSSFGGILGAKSKGDFCRIRVMLDVREPLGRGIFIKTDNDCKSWILFKYEKLPSFCFGCERIGHGVQSCSVVGKAIKDLPEDNLPFSMALKAELNFLGKINLKLGVVSKRLMEQGVYLGEEIDHTLQEIV